MMNALTGLRRVRLLLAMTGALVAAAPGPTQPGDPQPDASLPARDPQTRDRISGERLEALVAGPARLIREGRIEAAERAFEILLARRRPGTAAASDRLTAFGLEMFMSGDAAARERSVSYFARAVAAARTAFGPNHPEIALSLNTYADAQTEIWPDDPPRAADAALAEAYRIRLAALGPRNVETLANLIGLADLAGLPSRTGGDPARIETVAAQYREALRTADNRRGPAYGYEYNDFAISLRLAGMYGRNGLREPAVAALRRAIQSFRLQRGRAEDDPCFAFSRQVMEMNGLLDDPGQDALAKELGALVEAEAGIDDGCFGALDLPQSAIATVLSSV
jgi:hypothetical protein